MTCTRTQTALTRLAKLLTNQNGELELEEPLNAELPDYRMRFTPGGAKLAEERTAMCATIKQFDPDVGCTLIASSNDWSKAYRRQGCGPTMAYPRGLVIACRER